MKLTHFALAVTLVAFPTMAVAQDSHQGHATPAGQDMKMMPALNDANFVEMMSRHHRGGIALAKAEESRGSRGAVKALAASIRSGQERDLQELEAHKGAHEHPAAGGTATRGTSGQPRSADSMQKHEQMMDTMARESLARVENAQGEAADIAFLQEMAKHHQMALNMIAKANLKEPELRKMSQKMAAEQKRELQEITQLQSSK